MSDRRRRRGLTTSSTRRGAFALAAWLVAGTGPLAAQPAAPRIAAVALDPVVSRGPGVVVRLRLTTTADATPLTGARIVAARAVSPRGAIAPATGVSVSGEGVYSIRAALEQPGDWKVELTVAVFDRSPVTVSASLRVVDDASVALRADRRLLAHPAYPRRILQVRRPRSRLRSRHSVEAVAEGARVEAWPRIELGCKDLQSSA